MNRICRKGQPRLSQSKCDERTPTRQSIKRKTRQTKPRLGCLGKFCRLSQEDREIRAWRNCRNKHSFGGGQTRNRPNERPCPSGAVNPRKVAGRVHGRQYRTLFSEETLRQGTPGHSGRQTSRPSSPTGPQPDRHPRRDQVKAESTQAGPLRPGSRRRIGCSSALDVFGGTLIDNRFLASRPPHCRGFPCSRACRRHSASGPTGSGPGPGSPRSGSPGGRP